MDGMDWRFAVMSVLIDDNVQQCWLWSGRCLSTLHAIKHINLAIAEVVEDVLYNLFTRTLAS